MRAAPRRHCDRSGSRSPPAGMGTGRPRRRRRTERSPPARRPRIRSRYEGVPCRYDYSRDREDRSCKVRATAGAKWRGRRSGRTLAAPSAEPLPTLLVTRIFQANWRIFGVQACSGLRYSWPMILETAVGRVRECGSRAVRQGATTRRAAPCQEEPRRQAAREPCARARSGLTRPMSSNHKAIFSHSNHLSIG